jgi:dihydropteroate synthase
MQQAPEYDDVVGTVLDFFEDRLAGLAAAGVNAAHVVLDPGIGFGKNLGHNLDLLAHLNTFKSAGRPLLVGVSRKSFMGALLGIEPSQRLSAGLACTHWALREGASIFRTHDVSATVQGLRMTEALMARSQVPHPA